MKRLDNKVAMVALRAAVALSGITCTLVTMLFCNSINSLVIAALLGGSMTVLIDNHLTEINK